jgi:hypothetical protein
MRVGSDPVNSTNDTSTAVIGGRRLDRNLSQLTSSLRVRNQRDQFQITLVSTYTAPRVLYPPGKVKTFNWKNNGILSKHSGQKKAQDQFHQGSKRNRSAKPSRTRMWPCMLFLRLLVLENV